MADQLDSEGNLQYYPNKPYLPDSYLIDLALLQEALGTRNEDWFPSKLQTDYSRLFPNLSDRNRYNRRRRRIAYWIHQLARLWGKFYA